MNKREVPPPEGSHFRSHEISLMIKGEKRGEGEDGRQLLKVDVSKRIMSYLQDSSRHVQEPWFRVPEFVDWLFSRENQVCSGFFIDLPLIFNQNQFVMLSYSTPQRTGRFART